MSASLTAPGLLPAGTLTALLEDLFPASFRGVEFHMPASDAEGGRRVITVLFPGRDAVLHEDIGALPRRITVEALIVGDDYVRRAEALLAACERPGPGTLVHPWLGELQVVAVEPARLTFTERELRVARLTLVFERWQDAAATRPDTLGGLLAAADALRAEARGLLRRVLAPVRLAVGVVAGTNAFVAGLATTWRSLLNGVTGGSSLRAVLDQPLAVLAGFTVPVTAASPGDATADVTEAVPLAALRAGQSAPAPAIGPAVPLPAVAGDPRAAAELLLAGVAAQAGGPAEAAPLRVAVAAQALAEAARLGTELAFESRGAARAWRGRLDAACGGAIADAARLSATEPEGAGLLLAALSALRDAALRDLDERIGRLPQVVQLTAPEPGLPAWLVAQHLAGDEPGRVVALHADLVARNRLPHPAVIPGGTRLEALP
jgi:prophage DNA circulation protein